jgi:hypothetical protein
MTRRAAFREADVRRLVKGAISAGLPAGSFVVKVVGDELQLLPIAANAPSDDGAEMARRMREAFEG